MRFRCCKMHDWCYDATDCPMFSEYFVPYYWRCYHGYKPVCGMFIDYHFIFSHLMQLVSHERLKYIFDTTLFKFNQYDIHLYF